MAKETKRVNPVHNTEMISDPYPLSNESAGDNEGDINGIPAHNNSVEPFKKASSAPTRCRIHGDANLKFPPPDLCELGFAKVQRRC